MLLRSLNHATSRLASLSRWNVAVDAAKRMRDRPSPPHHHLILYEYEASPWCRLVREYATILDLQLHIRPCPRQTLFLEGAFDVNSRFRPEAMEYLKQYHQTDDLTFPMLVDQTDDSSTSNNPIVKMQSYDILEHLWERYGQGVLPTSGDALRPDQRRNSNKIPFPLRFLSLAAPSYFRPWPTCGILQTPSLWNNDENRELVLYQAEGCSESRLVREMLCTLELPYLSIPKTNESSHQLPTTMNDIPVLVDNDSVIQGADECRRHLWNKYKDPNSALPQWWNLPPQQNIGRAGSFGIGAYTAFVRGNRAFVPDKAFE
jgi:hypothetical protein